MSKLKKIVLSERFVMMVTVVIASLPAVDLSVAVVLGVPTAQLLMVVIAILTSAAWWSTVVVQRRLRVLSAVALLVNDGYVDIARSSRLPLVTSWVLVLTVVMPLSGIGSVILYAAMVLANIFTCIMVGANFTSTVDVYRRALAALEDGDVYEH